MSVVIEPAPFKAEGPQPLLRPIPKGQPFPVDALGPLRPAVEAVQGMTQAPVAIPAASALSVASLAVQGFADVKTLGGRAPLSLFMLTLARSGERKSGCDRPLMEALRDFEKEQQLLHRDEMHSWIMSQTLWKASRERIVSEVKKKKGNDRTAAQADLEALGKEPEAPPSTDRTVAEPTYEGLVRLFITGQPSLGIFTDEGAQFLGGHAMNSDNRVKTMAGLNALWSGDPIRRTRSGDGHVTLWGRRLAAHILIQIGVAMEFMSDPMTKDTGFLPRFLITDPGSTIGGRIHANSRWDWPPLHGFSRALRAILDRPMPMDPETRELQPRVLPLSQEAEALLIDFADRVEVGQAPGGPFEHVTGFASKAAEQATRIAAVLALWRDLDAREVEAEDMVSGTMLADFYLSEATRLASAATVSDKIAKAEDLRQWLIERWAESEITSTEVLQFGPNGLRESLTAKEAIKLLVDHGWLVPLESGAMVRGKARKSAWRIVRGKVS